MAVRCLADPASDELGRETGWRRYGDGTEKEATAASPNPLQVRHVIVLF
jgi:hypothetical protein